MFGPKLRIEYDGLGVNLCPLKKEWMALFAEEMSSINTNANTMSISGYCLESEIEWYETNRVSKNSINWAILPDGCDCPIGTTAITNIDYFGGCKTGIVILDRKWWGKGVASRAHLMRTWYASEILNRITIHSEVLEGNIASSKALEKVGYVNTGRYLRNYRKGGYSDVLTYSWLHPEKISLLYPEGLPIEYEVGVKKAQEALNKAREKIELP